MFFILTALMFGFKAMLIAHFVEQAFRAPQDSQLIILWLQALHPKMQILTVKVSWVEMKIMLSLS
ncbi:hypothetical protein NC651_024086 [Populus alba x Populus x berolinensis]|nr:hypothetical protein NC651_024086 [Populus alba x Populus x berolinensis]